MNLVARSGWRHHVGRPILLFLSVLGVAVGVAMVVSIDAANTSARRAFVRSADALSGRATHVVRSSEDGVDDSVYVDLSVSLPRITFVPVLEGTLRTRTSVLRLLGIDPFVDGTVRNHEAMAGFPDPADLVTRPGAIVLSEATAGDLGLTVGDSLDATSDGRGVRLVVVGIVHPKDPVEVQGWEGLAIADLSTAQEALGRVGRLSRIDVVLPEGMSAEAIESRLGPGYGVAPAGDRGSTLARMTRAFELNLEALSYLALLVGLFLVYNVVSFSVARRRMVLGRLRAIGVSSRSLTALVLGEALLIGAVGTAIGLGLGVMLATGLVQLVTRAINDLYFVVHVRELELTAGTWVKAVVLGLGTTLVAAWGPARRAGAARPAIEMRRSDGDALLRSRFGRMFVLAAAALTVGAAFLSLETGLAGAYAGLLLVVLAFALLTPVVTDVLARGVSALSPAAGSVRLAAGAIRAHLGRTSIAVAALALAIASSIGVGVMVSSFRGTVETWLSYALPADVYVRPPSAVARLGGGTIDTTVVRWLTTDPAVRSSYGVRRLTVGTSVGDVDLVALEHGPETHGTYRFLERSAVDPWEASDSGRSVLISEPFANRFGVSMGDSITVATDVGLRTMGVAAVFYDYGSDLGSIMVGRPAFEALFRDRSYSGMALFLHPGQDRDAVVRRLEERTRPVQELYIGSSASLRQASIEVFDRTFAVTVVLRFLALVVAFVGILTTLASQLIDRAWEFGVLRALGLGPGALRRILTLEAALMGGIAGILAVPLGLLLAAGLIFVVNRRAFGWTLQFDVSPDLVAQAVLVSIVAGVLAGSIPGWRAGRTRVTSLLRGLLVVLPVLLWTGCRPEAPRPGSSISEALEADTTGYDRVLGPRPFDFPADHGPHDDFRIEWWYFTGHLETAGGRRFGYQFTVFRNAMQPPAGEAERASGWATRQAYSAHLALSDPEGNRFHHDERYARGALGLAGAEGDDFRIWLGSWTASGPGTLDSIRVHAFGEDFGIDLVLRPTKPIVLQGEAGFSRKGTEPGQASMYYALTRLRTDGFVKSGPDTIQVTGASWFDREWSTSLLSPDQVGWDWFSLHLDSGDDLMLFRLRRPDGSTAFADASLVDADGRRLPIDASGLSFEPLSTWSSPTTGVTYPVAWRVTSASPAFDLRTRALMPEQELRTRVTYWEGAVDASGSWEDRPVSGRGYVELTGYGDTK